VPSLLAPFSRTTPCRLSADASGLITAIIWNFPAKNSQILRLFDKIKGGEELQIIAMLSPIIFRARLLEIPPKFKGHSLRKRKVLLF